MAVRKVKVKEGEKLSAANIERVISLLEAEKPITKKDACAILNIAYNTTRLGKIIDEYKAKQELVKKRRAANRGKPASDQEIIDVIIEYLRGDPVSTIADGLYRSTTFVSNILDSVGVPRRSPGETYWSFEPLPERCISDTFEVGEIAWSCRYQSACFIEKDLGTTKDNLSKLYRIYVVEKHSYDPEASYYVRIPQIMGFFASQPAYDVGKLSHLKERGIDVERKLIR